MPNYDDIIPMPTYEDFGFSKFLQKAVGGRVSAQPIGRTGSINLDQTQFSGSLGSKWQVGPITIDGINNRIIVNDGERDRILIGYDDGGF